MRQLLTTALCLAAFAILPISAQSVKSNQAILKVDGNHLQLETTSGEKLLNFRGVALSWSPQSTESGNATVVDANTLAVDYAIKNDPSGQVKIRGTFALKENRLDIEFHLSVPDGVNVGGAMILRQAIAPQKSALYKEGEWQRLAQGGIPYEVRAAYLNRYEYKTVAVAEIIAGNHGWFSNSGQHLAFAKSGDEYVGKTSYIITPRTATPEAVAAWFSGKTMAIKITMPKDFNLWGENETPEFTVRLSNLGSTVKGRLKVWVKDYDGQELLNTEKEITLNGGELNETFKIAGAKSQNIYFIEASLQENGQELCFSRTTAATIHDYKFGNKTGSIMGMASDFDIPSKPAVDKLLERMGVYWIRRGDTTKTMKSFGAIANWHSNYKQEQFSNDPAAKTAALKKELTQCDRQQNLYWEFCNEWNMASLNTGKNADVYVTEWLKPLAKLREKDKNKVKIMSMGIAGGDIAYLKAIHKNGGWPLIDAVAFHPGRGNFTADYDNQKADWTYLGSVKKVKQTVTELGDKPLFITEAYACTMPNSWWHDSYRNAADNVILTFALAMEEDIKAVMFYMLHDSVWHDVGGVKHTDSEYSYGMLHRDGSVKPSLLAYCTIAEALDQAKFIKRLTFSNSKIKGLLFESPKGKIQILWSRQDGYILSKKDNFSSSEPWIDQWKNRTSFELETTGKRLKVVDCIGRHQFPKEENGKVLLKLSGSPIIIYEEN